MEVQQFCVQFKVENTDFYLTLPHSMDIMKKSSVSQLLGSITSGTAASCGYGGIGRRARFRFWSERVQVQVLLSALFFKAFHEVSWRAFFVLFYKACELSQGFSCFVISTRNQVLNLLWGYATISSKHFLCEARKETKRQQSDGDSEADSFYE